MTLLDRQILTSVHGLLSNASAVVGESSFILDSVFGISPSENMRDVFKHIRAARAILAAATNSLDKVLEEDK